MPTTQEKLTALQKRVFTAQNAIKLAEKLGPKIAVKEAEVAALEASLATCPDGQTKNGLAKRVGTLNGQLANLKKERDDAEKEAYMAVDLAVPFGANPFAGGTTDGSTATGTEGGEVICRDEVARDRVEYDSPISPLANIGRPD